MKQFTKEVLHEPVLFNEVIKALKVRELALSKRKPNFIDATLGLGGHTRGIVLLGGNVLGIDLDKKMLKLARRFLAEACPIPDTGIRGSYTLVHGNFREIDELAAKKGFDKVDGILFDLGISLTQIKSLDRGFSFQDPEAPLDMRIDPQSQAIKASDLLNSLREDQLFELFNKVLRAKEAKNLSREIVEARRGKEIEKVGQFLQVIGEFSKSKKDLHQATLPFLALRMAVNSELANLQEALPKALALIRASGRLVVITYHSGEDLIVKRFFKEKVKENKAKILTKKPIVPAKSEIARNPRSRSAKMRILEKI